MKNAEKNALETLFVAVAFLLFASLGLSAVYSAVRSEREKKENGTVEFVRVSFAEAYPFDGVGTGEPIYFGANKNASLLGSYVDKMTDAAEFTEKYSGKENILSLPFYDLFGKITKVLGKDMTDDAENPVIMLENGYLTYAYLYSETPEAYESFSDFNDWLKERNIPFLPVITAHKSDDRYAVFPEGFPHGYAKKEEEYVRYLEDNGFEFLNSREMLLKETDDFYSLFYRTDHHWNVRAGFSVASGIAEKMKNTFGLDVDTEILSRDNFECVTYKNAFLGSAGKKATHGYVSPEDFEVYYPVFDSSFSVEIPTLQIDKTGDFGDTLINSDVLKTDHYYTNNNYEAFLYGDSPLTRVRNLKCNNGVRALVIKESKADVVDTYLAFAVEYLDIIDPRHFDGSIRTFIEMTDPDVVLTCGCPPTFGDNDMWDIR